MTALFDKFLNKLIIDIGKLIARLIKGIFRKWSSKRSNKWNYIYTIIKDVYSPVKKLFIWIFTFRSPNYFSENEILKNECIEMINTKYKTQFPQEWHTLYKFSTVINNQENIKSLGFTFLAKYNFYRSMAFIFSLIFFFFIFFFSNAELLLSKNILSLKSLILVGIALLWFTFHYKYKRYWTLCGNETLVSLFYFMKKN